VEDTWNLLGRALGAVVTCAAATLKVPRAQVLEGAGVTLLGASSLKAALDIDWSDPAAQADALARLLAQISGSSSERSATPDASSRLKRGTP